MIPTSGTNLAAGFFDADADPTTTTDPNLDDTDAGGVSDGVEDVDLNGRVDPGERDPNAAFDDLCSLVPPVAVDTVTVSRSGDDVVLVWPSLAGGCTTYRVYAATTLRPTTFSDFVVTGPPGFSASGDLLTVPTYTHFGGVIDGNSYSYLVVRVSTVTGEGVLGHFGR